MRRARAWSLPQPYGGRGLRPQHRDVLPAAPIQCLTAPCGGQAQPQARWLSQTLTLAVALTLAMACTLVA